MNRMRMLKLAAWVAVGVLLLLTPILLLTNAVRKAGDFPKAEEVSAITLTENTDPYTSVTYQPADAVYQLFFVLIQNMERVSEPSDNLDSKYQAYNVTFHTQEKNEYANLWLSAGQATVVLQSSNERYYVLELPLLTIDNNRILAAGVDATKLSDESSASYPGPDAQLQIQSISDLAALQRLNFQKQPQSLYVRVFDARGELVSSGEGNSFDFLGLPADRQLAIIFSAGYRYEDLDLTVHYYFNYLP